MSDQFTIARPYAKAAFQEAVRLKDLSLWSDLLQLLEISVADANGFLLNPDATHAQKLELLVTVMKHALSNSILDLGTNFVNVLLDNNRILLLPEIRAEFEILRAEYEKTLEVYVKAFFPLTEFQRERLVERLSKKLQRQVTLKVAIDPTLLGGIVIYAGDLVIDDSVKSKLMKLNTSLVA